MSVSAACATTLFPQVVDAVLSSVADASMQACIAQVLSSLRCSTALDKGEHEAQLLNTPGQLGHFPKTQTFDRSVTSVSMLHVC